MSHPVRFKLLLLLMFAVWMRQCKAFADKSTILNDCCIFGKSQSKSSCSKTLPNFNLLPEKTQIECRSRIKYCCRKKRDTEDCNEGINLAQNGTECPTTFSKHMICYKACSFGIKMAEKGEDCNKTLLGYETLEIDAIKWCCEMKRKEILLPDDEETDEAVNNDDDDDDDYEAEENEGLLELQTTQSDSEPATSTTQQTTTETTTAEPTTTTSEKPIIDYDDVTEKLPTTTTTSIPDTTTRRSFWSHLDSLETNEIDTATTTTRRSPPKFKHLSSNDEASTVKPASEEIKYFTYERPQNGVNLFRFFFGPNSIPDSSKFQASSRNSGNNPEPCGDTRYCDHSCIVMHGVQRCSCNPGYSLQRDGRTCLRADGAELPPEEIRKVQKRCQPGHFLNDFGDCQDIDECRIQNNGCGDKAICRNTDGSYECIPTDVCRVGFRFNEKLRICEDINECSENPRICEYGQVCNNTVGSYTCEDSFSEFKERCEELVFTTPPTTSSTTRRSFTTQEPCHRGFERNYKGICVDIDECLQNPCEQGLICVNRNGGYTCEVSHCSSGFKPDGKSCIDINECDSNPCPMTHNCLNTHGSYACKIKNCPRGYKLDIFGGCEDINECKIYNNLCRNAVCINTDGSFVCICKVGYKKDENGYCRDINECAEGIHDCSHQCSNKYGGYECLCDKGYRLDSDKKTCVDVDECKERGEFLCLGECVNLPGGYECKCPAGFRRDELYCTDIDECEEHPEICNKKTSQCLNIAGSYKCMDIRCSEGYKLVRRNGERYCHLRTPCGEDDYDEDCNKPWMYSNAFKSRTANCSASTILQMTITTQQRYDVTLEDVRAYSTKENIKKAAFDDFLIEPNLTGFFLSTTRPIDGPQDVDVNVLITFYRPDGSIEHKRGLKVKFIVSEFPFYKFMEKKVSSIIKLFK